MFDSYLGDELLVETNHEVLRHLEGCAACRGELADRRALRAHVRSAVRRSGPMQIDSQFAVGLRSSLHETAHRASLRERFATSNLFNFKTFSLAAAGLLFFALAGTLWLSRSTSESGSVAVANTPPNQTSTPAQPIESPLADAVRVAWRQVTGDAVGDHLNCALDFKLAEKPISLKEAARKYGTFNRDLDKAVIPALNGIFSDESDGKAGKVTLLDAHSCVFNGRRFAHLVLLYRNRRVSVMVTKANLPQAAGDEKVLSDTNDGRLVAAHFRAGDQIVFVVSDLNESENNIIAEKLAPGITRYIYQNAEHA